MVLATYIPEKTFPYSQLDILTGKYQGKWTWPIRGIVMMKRMGFDVTIIERFDIRRFAERGKSYLIEKYGTHVAGEQDEHSLIPAAQEDAQHLLSVVTPQMRIPAISDIAELLGQGYVIVANINSKMLNRKRGYVGHFVVIHGITAKTLVMHDPGLPPRPNRRVTKRVFEESWGYPNAEAKNIVAYRKI